MTDKKLFTTIDEYISTFPADIQIILEEETPENNHDRFPECEIQMNAQHREML